MTKFKSILVGDLIVMERRIWRVTGCYVGALGHEDMISIECLDRKPGSTEKDVKDMHVPVDMIPHNAVFRAVDHDLWQAGPPVAASSPAILAA